MAYFVFSNLWRDIKVFFSFLMKNAIIVGIGIIWMRMLFMDIEYVKLACCFHWLIPRGGEIRSEVVIGLAYSESERRVHSVRGYGCVMRCCWGRRVVDIEAAHVTFFVREGTPRVVGVEVLYGVYLAVASFWLSKSFMQSRHFVDSFGYREHMLLHMLWNLRSS